ncbi:MAG: IS1595 family transposase, partial [Treponema sp.]|nr:IS1595 family transposase [Treponema sp.]
KHLPAYLNEYSFRFNRRHFSGQLFNRLINACMTSPTITYRELVEPAPT